MRSVVLETDALSAALVLQGDAAHSPVMQHIHEELLSLYLSGFREDAVDPLSTISQHFSHTCCEGSLTLPDIGRRHVRGWQSTVVTAWSFLIHIPDRFTDPETGEHLFLTLP